MKVEKRYILPMVPYIELGPNIEEYSQSILNISIDKIKIKIFNKCKSIIENIVFNNIIPTEVNITIEDY